MTSIITYGDFIYKTDKNNEICINGIEKKYRFTIFLKSDNRKIKLRIPSKIDGKFVKYIDSEAFKFCNKIKSVKIPNSVIGIGSSAFDDCSSLKKIYIPSSVVYIGGGVFSRCSNLEKVKILNKKYEVINRILFNKKEKSVISCFSDKAYISIPLGIKKIECMAFSFCGLLKSVTLPSSVVIIEPAAFWGCSSLESIELPNSITNIIIPNSVTKIGDSAFAYCESLTSIVLPDSLVSIGEQVFEGCDSLTIQCNAGSYAEQYCKENNLKYFTTPDWLLD